jgi:pyrroline-5-carboxylate reductase
MQAMQATRIGFLGAGNMAGALIAGLLDARAVTAAQIRVSDTRPSRLEELTRLYGIQTHTSNIDLVSWANVVVLSVKPGVVPAVLDQCGASIGGGHLIISVAAGVPIRAIASRLGPGARIVRTMPNTPALSRAGATALALGASAAPGDMEIARGIFDAVGKTVVLDEGLLDAVTGLSGSGPAFVMLMVDALADGGVKAGLPKDVALLLATQTVYGAAKMLLDTSEHPAKLKDMVTSPGGTTISGLAVLEARGVRGAFLDAVDAATRRSAELGKKDA